MKKVALSVRPSCFSRPRPVGGEIDRRWPVSQPLPPVGELAGEELALEARPLPLRHVGVLQGGRRKGRGLAGREGAVEARQLVEEDLDGAAVEHDVVHVDQQVVARRLEAQQPGAQQGSTRQVERAPGLLGGQSPGLGLALRRRQGAEVDEW
jgi:hypothetical protein